MRHALCLCAAVLALSLSSCSTKKYDYELRGVVLDAETGQPIPGVKVVLKDHFEIKTDSKGAFQGKLQIDETHFKSSESNLEGWDRIKLKLNQAGYDEALVDITPTKIPEKEPVKVVIYAHLHKAKLKPE